MDTVNDDMDNELGSLFADLSLELQEKIIIQYTKLLITFYKVSHASRDALKSVYLQYIGNLPFSLSESRFTLMSQPTQTINVIGRHENIQHHLIGLNHRRLMDNITENIEIEFNHVNVQKITIKPGNGNVEGKYSVCQGTTDFFTLYTLLSRRLSCMNIDKNYAKKKVHTSLEIIYQRYTSKERTSADIISVYINLVLNKYVFNICDGSDIHKLSHFHELRVQIEKDIEVLYQEIKRKILLLD